MNLISCVLALSLLVAAASCSSSSSVVVEIGVYYETLCPDSIRFVNRQLTRVRSLIVDPAFKEIVDVKLYPYGKANTQINMTSNLYNFQCQHGPMECYGNKAHNCALEHFSYDFEKVFDYINCTMNFEALFNQQFFYNSLYDCADASQMGPSFSECLKGTRGDILLAAAGQATPRLNYVPWITVNGKRDKPAERDIIEAICRNYNGDADVSSICKSGMKQDFDYVESQAKAIVSPVVTTLLSLAASSIAFVSLLF